MGLTFGFYNSVNGDRRYNAEQLSEIFDGVINDGVFMSVGVAFITTPGTGMQSIVGTGRAWFNKTWTNNDSPLILLHDAAGPGLGRIDAVVLEVNTASDVRANSIKIVKGTPSGTPQEPEMLNTATVKQYPLAMILIPAGSTAILPENITNKVGTSACPFVTGILETVNVDALLTQWNAQFVVWFDSVKDILDENTAGNLLNMINTINDELYSTGGINDRILDLETAKPLFSAASTLYLYKNIGGSF